jgi:hypothetical protein
MSLLVNAYLRDKTGKMVFLDPDDGSEELAGFEVYRKTFYGGAAAQSLGLRLLVSLRETDLYAEGEDLRRLQNEAHLVAQNIQLFVTEAGANAESLMSRMRNILSAIGRAQKVNGGVVIW